MKYVPWAAAGVVVVVAIAAIIAVVLPGRQPTTARPAELWGELSRPLGQPGPVPTETERRTLIVVEQDSSIVGEDSKLVESLGIESPPGRFRTVLPRGTPVPVGRIVTFRTGADNQREIRVHVLRGRTDLVAESHSLGWVRIYDLPAGPRGATRIAITFEVIDRAIRLAAQNPDTGRPLPIEASEAPPGFPR